MEPNGTRTPRRIRRFARRETLEGCRRVLGDDHPHTLASINNMGTLLRDMGHLAEAEALGAEAVERARNALPPGHSNTAIFLSQHARALAAMQRFAEAETELLEAHETLVAALGTHHDWTVGVIKSLIDLYDAWHAAEPDADHHAQAAQWRTKLAEWQASTQPASQPAAP